jgi:glycerol uptake facilitator-like aquaporin
VLQGRLLRVTTTVEHRRAVAGEFVGTAFLLAAVVGSGIMGEQLAGGNVAIALLANALATGAALVALIVTFGPVSGAHFNPLVTILMGARGGGRGTSAAYVFAQLAGAVCGVLLAHVMFGAPLVAWSTHVRSGLSQVISEAVATFGLIGVIVSGSRRTPAAVPFAVAAYIVAAYWFTASTSFANPAVTLARALTDTFAGIRAADVPWFMLGQAAGAGLAAAVFGWLVPDTAATTGRSE